MLCCKVHMLTFSHAEVVFGCLVPLQETHLYPYTASLYFSHLERNLGSDLDFSLCCNAWNVTPTRHFFVLILCFHVLMESSLLHLDIGFWSKCVDLNWDLVLNWAWLSFMIDHYDCYYSLFEMNVNTPGSDVSLMDIVQCRQVIGP